MLRDPTGRHPSQGVFTRFDPQADPAWDTRYRFTRVQRAGCVGKNDSRGSAQGADSLELLLDVLAEDPYAAMISLGRRPNIPRPGRLCGPAGGHHWSGYLDLGLRRGTLSSGDLPLECGSPATYEGMTVFLETERDKGATHGRDGAQAHRQRCPHSGTDRPGLCLPRSGCRSVGTDWEHFAAKENLADPRHGPQGLDYVLVAGQIAVDHGTHTHVRTGTVLGPEHRKGEN